MNNTSNQLFDLKNDQKKKSSGPPNRMNDLAYRDWMKFQKSFFIHQSASTLVIESVNFFTKAIWPDGNQSRSLVVGFESFKPETIPHPRIVDLFQPTDIYSLIEHLYQLVKDARVYDFALLDLRPFLSNDKQLTDFLDNHADSLFSALRKLLHPMRYCGLVADSPGVGGNGLPYPWAVALSGRKHLRLRDEKVGLVEATGSTYYCLFFQANDDIENYTSLPPAAINIAKDSIQVPAWIIPRPPPRKPNEILHPAKFPETLIGHFIEIFTEPGQNVFDPMMGTGSSIVAALRVNRNAYGIDLNPEFVSITKQRIQDEQIPSLFQEFDTNADSRVVAGDSTRLDEISEFESLRFHYVVTSPPYWSMLANPGSENQKKRREQNLRLVYSDSEQDLGNISSYDEFLSLLTVVYNQVADKLVDNGYLTVVVKNVKREHIIYPLAWDITARLCGPTGRYSFIGNTFWCQDDVPLKPFAVGIHWVSNTLHHYCLHFQRRI